MPRTNFHRWALSQSEFIDIFNLSFCIFYTFSQLGPLSRGQVMSKSCRRRVRRICKQKACRKLKPYNRCAVHHDTQNTDDLDLRRPSGACMRCGVWTVGHAIEDISLRLHMAQQALRSITAAENRRSSRLGRRDCCWNWRTRYPRHPCS